MCKSENNDTNISNNPDKDFTRNNDIGTMKVVIKITIKIKIMMNQTNSKEKKETLT